MNLLPRIGGSFSYGETTTCGLHRRGLHALPDFLLLVCLLCLLGGCQAERSAQLAGPQPMPVVVANAAANQDIISVARSSIGTRYKYGGNSPTTGFDCSGFICWTFEQVGVQLPRSAREQANIGAPVARNALMPGDIIVFKGTNHRSGWHAGIYTGNGNFIHSPRSGKTVVETPLDTDYYNKHYYAARRIPRSGDAAMLAASHPPPAHPANTVMTSSGDIAKDSKKSARKSKKRSAKSKNTKSSATAKKSQ